jgi:hypothetical protein
MSMKSHWYKFYSKMTIEDLEKTLIELENTLEENMETTYSGDQHIQDCMQEIELIEELLEEKRTKNQN